MKKDKSLFDEKYYLGRKIVLKSLVGSHNYNLNDESSDEDYKIFIVPTFDDLYNKEMFSSQVIGARYDYTFHDIRKLITLLYKSNINFLEVLFSSKMFISDNIKDLHYLRDDVSRINLPYLFDSCKGTFYSKMKRIDKSTDKTRELVEKYGYNTKEAMHAYRSLKIVVDFYNNGFNNFENVIKYNDNDRLLFLDIKNGAFPKEDFIFFVNDFFNNSFIPLSDKYKQHEPNIKLKKTIDEIIKSTIASEICIK